MRSTLTLRSKVSGHFQPDLANMNSITLTHSVYDTVTYQEPGAIRRIKREVAKHLEEGWTAVLQTPSGEIWTRRWDAKRWTHFGWLTK